MLLAAAHNTQRVLFRRLSSSSLTQHLNTTKHLPLLSALPPTGLLAAAPQACLLKNKQFSTRAASTASASAPPTTQQQQGPLSLFVCAVDEASDQAAAALVAALKQLTGRQVDLHGVGGKQLSDLGLHSVVSDDELHTLAAAEVIPPTQRFLQGSAAVGDSISKSTYAKIFRDTIWDAAHDGCRGRPLAQHQLPQSSRGGDACGGGGGAASQQQQQPSLCYDAVLTVGSPTAAQLMLNFLRQAEKARKAKLPVVLQYMVPGLWDHQQATAAAARWSNLVDHVLCAMPFEPPLLHAAGVPSTFVGHPLLQQLLGSSTSVSSFGGKARVLTALLQQQEQGSQQAAAVVSTTGRQQQQQQQRRQRQGKGAQGVQPQPAKSLFAAGDATAFWRCYEEAHSVQQEAADAAAAAADAANDPSAADRQLSSSKRRGTYQPSQQQQSSTRPQQRQQQRQLLLALLPGTTEAEVISSMSAFDSITQALHERHPDLLATLHVPEVLVPAAVAATINFRVPVLVVASEEKRACDALAAAAAAISHPGPASLTAVAAGLPLVCVRDGSALKSAWTKWRQKNTLSFGCIPNLLLGRAAVPEVDMWSSGGLEAAVQAVQQLLQARGSSSVEQQQQRTVLQEALLRLVAPVAQQQQAGAAAAGVNNSSSVGWQLPGEAAARTLLELIELRQQQESGQRTRAAAASSRAHGTPGASGSNTSSSGGRSSSRAGAADQRLALGGSA